MTPERERLVKWYYTALGYHSSLMEVVASRPPVWADIPAAWRLLQIGRDIKRAAAALAAYDAAHPEEAK